MATGNPLIQQGTLNKVRASVIVPGNSSLNITAAYMGKNFVTVSLEGDFTKLIGTATGAVTSPEPYVEGTISVGILRTQSLASNWRSQWENNGVIGGVSVFPDTAAFGEIDFHDCVIQHFEPNAWDGEDPVSRLTIKGLYFINNAMWSF